MVRSPGQERHNANTVQKRPDKKSQKQVRKSAIKFNVDQLTAENETMVRSPGQECHGVVQRHVAPQVWTVQALLVLLLQDRFDALHPPQPHRVDQRTGGLQLGAGGKVRQAKPHLPTEITRVGA